ncbi:protein ligase [Alicyclobacillus hesperidum subsp. aegles]|uniref:lipoate--protein ligase family protein n=1 Tax=Alicyclobacillus hesperidum TaxID=89784 RepID=UPI00222D6D07|nr:ligase [Alicyclobacillus hesperidum]GLG01435.1 protein ligase [Alicyclobacillus hesperidum subsp. aegles]
MSTADWRVLLPTELDIVTDEFAEHPLNNILYDDEIAKQVAQGARRPTVRVWRHAPVQGLVVSRRDVAGANGEFAMAAMADEGWPIFVRSTGGTAVPHGSGMLNMSIIFPRQHEKATTDAYYRLLCQPLIDWFVHLGLSASTGEVPGSYCDGGYNVQVDGKKIVGTAQAWRGGLAGTTSRHPGYVLAHACIAIDLDIGAAISAINRFYGYAGAAIDVQPETASTLEERLQRPFDSAKAKRSLVDFLGSYLTTQGVNVRC